MKHEHRARSLCGSSRCEPRLFPIFLSSGRPRQRPLLCRCFFVRSVRVQDASESARFVVFRKSNSYDRSRILKHMRQQPVMLVDGDCFYDEDIVATYRSIAATSNGVFLLLRPSIDVCKA